MNYPQLSSSNIRASTYFDSYGEIIIQHILIIPTGNWDWEILTAKGRPKITKSDKLVTQTPILVAIILLQHHQQKNNNFNEFTREKLETLK